MNYNFNNTSFERKIIKEAFYKNLQFIFSGNSFVIYLSKEINNKPIKEILDETSGSEHWLSEVSDFFRVNNNGELSYIILNIPPNNKKWKFNLNVQQKKFSLFKLNEKKSFVVPYCSFRDFSAIDKSLTCFNDIDIVDENLLNVVMLTEEFNLIFYENKYLGFSLKNPLDYLTDDYNGIKDVSSEINIDEYLFFEEYFKILSDENIEKKNDDIGEVVLEVDKLLTNDIGIFKSKIRYKIVSNSVELLKDFYL